MRCVCCVVGVCVVCVIECAMVYGLLLLTVCARVDSKQTNMFVCFVWDLSCVVAFDVRVAALCACLGLVFYVFVRCL